MAPISSSSSAPALAPPHKRQLLDAARESIHKGLRGETPVVRAADFPEPLRLPRATFVTLHAAGELRGCIGTLEARKPLVEDVAGNAWSAAFQDTRFPALTWPEFELLEIHISILSPPQPMDFTSEEDLLAQLRPFVDGLVLEEGTRRGTFLPSVWEQLPDARAFLNHLKAKAGLEPEYWSKNIRVQRYVTESVS